MAALSANDRIAVLGSVVKALVDSGVDCTALLGQLQNTVNAADDWADANEGSYSGALPAAFTAWASDKDKALVLFHIIMRRYSMS